MLHSVLVRIVGFSARFAWGVIAAAAVLTGLCTIYAAQHFSVVTDVRQLFPTNLAWTKRATEFTNAFPQYEILVVVDAPTPELAERASALLTTAMTADRHHIRAAEEPQGGGFVARSALLFLPTRQLASATQQMQRAQPLLEVLAVDPSLRGILNALSAGLTGVTKHLYGLDSLAKPMSASADTIDNALHGRPATFSWQSLVDGAHPSVRRVIEVVPVLDFKALQPGRAATDSISNMARRLDLAGKYRAHVQSTGLVPMNDAQFATLKENAAFNAVISIAAVLIILRLALHSAKIIFAVIVSVICGMTFTAAFGLLLAGSLNLISVAFFVLFVGLAVDFGIQFSVRYRAERHETGALKAALVGAGRKAGWSLCLAAAATAIGFSAFLPTDYRGLSELGRIAGPGMIIAFLTSITLLPALLRVLDPPPEPEQMGFAGLAPIDEFLHAHRLAVLFGTLAVVALGLPFLMYLRFDFNTVHMQNPKSPPVATYLELRRDPEAGANAADFVAPNLSVADGVAREFAGLPTVAGTRTLSNLIPSDQPEKLKLIHQVATTIAPALNPPLTRPLPTDAENVAALLSTAQTLSRFVRQGGSGGRAAARLSGLLTRLAASTAATRQRVENAMVLPLNISLDDLGQSLKAQPVTVANLPLALKRDWLATNGQARVEILPKGDPEDTRSLLGFVQTILARRSDATGPAVMLYESGRTIVRAFIEAGLFALAAIAVLLWVALRRLADVAMTLIPLLLAALLTLELCAAFRVPLNFTNILAFPLLLGVGVAFKIYYVMAWRRGRTKLVQSTLTRAVLFSGLTTATAFGTLWMSHDPGTSSMGQLMALALFCTMMAAVLFQPALMGPPRKVMSDTSAFEPAAVRRQNLSAVAIERVDGRRA